MTHIRATAVLAVSVAALCLNACGSASQPHTIDGTTCFERFPTGDAQRAGPQLIISPEIAMPPPEDFALIREEVLHYHLAGGENRPYACIGLAGIGDPSRALLQSLEDAGHQVVPFSECEVDQETGAFTHQDFGEPGTLALLQVVCVEDEGHAIVDMGHRGPCGIPCHEQMAYEALQSDEGWLVRGPASY